MVGVVEVEVVGVVAVVAVVDADVSDAMFADDDVDEDVDAVATVVGAELPPPPQAASHANKLAQANALRCVKPRHLRVNKSIVFMTVIFRSFKNVKITTYAGII